MNHRSGSTDPASASGSPSRPWPAGQGSGRSRDPPVLFSGPGPAQDCGPGTAGAASWPVRPDRVISPAGAAAAGAAGSPAPGPAWGRPGATFVPGRVSGHRYDGRPRPLRLVTFMGRCPGHAWHGPWHGAPDNPAPPVPSVRFPVLSVQLMGPVDGAVFMVRRRCASIPCRGDACFPCLTWTAKAGAKFQPLDTCSSSDTMGIRARRHRPQAQLRGQTFVFV
jgi:hypothetical protein